MAQKALRTILLLFCISLTVSILYVYVTEWRLVITNPERMFTLCLVFSVVVGFVLTAIGKRI